MAEGSGRTQIRGPQRPPSLEETLLSPWHGHVDHQGRDQGQEHDDVGLRRLMTAQLRLALMLSLGFLGLLAGGYLLLASAPEPGETMLLGVPLAWLVPAFAFYPLMMVGAWVYYRASRRRERAYLAAQEAQQDPVQHSAPHSAQHSPGPQAGDHGR